MVSYNAMEIDTPFTIAGRTFDSRLLVGSGKYKDLSLIHISEPTRLLSISYAVFCLKKKKKHKNLHCYSNITKT